MTNSVSVNGNFILITNKWNNGKIKYLKKKKKSNLTETRGGVLLLAVSMII